MKGLLDYPMALFSCFLLALEGKSPILSSRRGVSGTFVVIAVIVIVIIVSIILLLVILLAPVPATTTTGVYP